MDCCHTDSPTPHNSDSHGHEHKKSVDYLLWGSITILLPLYILHYAAGYFPVTFAFLASTPLHHLGEAVASLFETMWWGILIGALFVGLLHYVPRELIMAILGPGGTFRGLLRATFAGVLLDLCSHGILMVGMKLYERGASIGQVMAFLIASPWNSFSLTLILLTLIGWKWTLAFIVCSMLIAVLTGIIFEQFVKKRILPSNPNQLEQGSARPFQEQWKEWVQTYSFKPTGIFNVLTIGIKESRMVIRWLFVGIILAATIRTFVPLEMYSTYFGASTLGLFLTLIAATVIEVCSEGSTPLAADLLTRAHAAGNSFAFLMTGVSTDYTEIMSLQNTTKSWKIALFLPLITLPQIVLIAWIMNGM
ncbi:MAG: putative permease [Rickettsiales bacterium]|jgi:uncharacterized membrane protein YraQ (UPF0718 family)|nr:putative permease [Rickettsiales bacterium]